MPQWRNGLPFTQELGIHFTWIEQPWTVGSFASFKNIFYGRLSLPSEDMANETPVESVWYHGDGNESLEVDWSYAFSCSFLEMCSELGIPPVAPLFHLRLFKIFMPKVNITKTTLQGNFSSICQFRYIRVSGLTVEAVLCHCLVEKSFRNDRTYTSFFCNGCDVHWQIEKVHILAAKLLKLTVF